MPPDVLGCTGYMAPEWPEMQRQFSAMCEDDPACRPWLADWKARFLTWASPTDSGTCVTWMTQKVYDIDAAHHLPKDRSSTKKPKSWPELAEESVLLPAKESYAPTKTFVQSFCHNKKECGAAGNWEGTVKATDKALEVQSKRRKK